MNRKRHLQITRHRSKIQDLMTSPTAVEVREARLAAKLTQAAAAELVGITTRAWQYYESGETTIKLPTWRLFKTLTPR
jgi:DNA-binding XRE family transcriptional regulator